jgi:hypothetical protein
VQSSGRMCQRNFTRRPFSFRLFRLTRLCPPSARFVARMALSSAGRARYRTETRVLDRQHGLLRQSETDEVRVAEPSTFFCRHRDRVGYGGSEPTQRARVIKLSLLAALLLDCARSSHGNPIVSGRNHKGVASVRSWAALGLIVDGPSSTDSVEKLV